MTDFNTEQANALRARAEMLHMRADQLVPRAAAQDAQPGSSSVVLALPGDAWLAVRATNVSDGLFACFVRDAVAAVLSAGASPSTSTRDSELTAAAPDPSDLP